MQWLREWRRARGGERGRGERRGGGGGGAVAMSAAALDDLLARAGAMDAAALPVAAAAPTPRRNHADAAAAAAAEPLRFVLNGKVVTVNTPSPGMTLARYLRDELGLTGTKLSCHEVRVASGARVNERRERMRRAC